MSAAAPTIMRTISSWVVSRVAPVACVPPVAQDDEAIGDAQHLFDEVRDVDNRVALRLEPLEHREQMLDVGRPEAARRLVQHEHGAAHRERARDLDDLLRRGREAPGRRIEREVIVAELGQRRAGDLAHASPVEHAKTRGLDAQGDVLNDGEVGRERQFLLDHRDAGVPCLTWIVRRVRTAANRHDAGIWPERARQDGHQRALAGAVLTDEAADLARRNRQIHASQRDGGPKPLGHAAHDESGGLRPRPSTFAQGAPSSAEGLGPRDVRHFTRSGSSSATISGCCRFCGVAIVTPVSIRASTGSFLRCDTIVFTPR